MYWPQENNLKSFQRNLQLENLEQWLLVFFYYRLRLIFLESILASNIFQVSMIEFVYSAGIMPRFVRFSQSLGLSEYR